MTLDHHPPPLPPQTQCHQYRSASNSNCHYDNCPDNICLGHICPYQEYCSCYWPNFKGRFLGPSLTDANCHDNICQGTICPGNICPYQEYLSCRWPNFKGRFLGPTLTDANSFYCPLWFCTILCDHVELSAIVLYCLVWSGMVLFSSLWICMV